jgi:hypothetical protein
VRGWSTPSYLWLALPLAAMGGGCGSDAARAADAAVAGDGADAGGATNAVDASHPAPDASSGDAAIDGPPARLPDTGGGADGTPPDRSPVDCSDPGCPSVIAPGNVQLWFRGDVGVECEAMDDAHRVRRWQDSSAHGRHAEAPPAVRGPLCGPSAGSIDGRAVIDFPRTTGAESEEHLEIDLQGIHGKSFTVAIVERRVQVAFNAWYLGSRLGEPVARCDGVNPNRSLGLAIGYANAATVYATVWGPNCDAKLNVPGVGEKPNITMVSYSPRGGLRLAVDGKTSMPVLSDGIVRTTRGLIGRGFDRPPGGADSRYRGQVAEIVVFDLDLTPEQQSALAGYLQRRWQSGP